MKIRNLVFLIALGTVTGCASVASSTNTLSDEKIRSLTAGTLSYQPDEVTVLDKRVDGTNTFVNVKAKNGKEYTCVINGGNLLTFGATNPPSCAKKGEPISPNGPFKR